MQQRLTVLDGEFKHYHLSIVNPLESAEELGNEQAAVDDHDDRVTDLIDRLECLAIPEEHEGKVKVDPQQQLCRRLQYVKQNLRKVIAAVSNAAEQADVDHCLLKQYDEQLNGFKVEVFDIYCSILS